MNRTLRTGTAGWTLSRDAAPAVPATGSHLQRYAHALRCAEINSSFYRSHRFEVYQRWAGQTPEDFRFAVKLPRVLTHDQGLRQPRAALLRFLAEVAGLGDRLGALLVQLPPSLAYEAASARTFFGLLGALFDRPIVCEPRHASWFTPAADALLARRQVARAAADPSRWSAGARPGGWLGDAGDGSGALCYYRWHGSPRMYWSRYQPAWLQARASDIAAWPGGTECWCIFDNTAGGGALGNALEMQALAGPA